MAGEYLKKGRPVFIEGRLQLDSWDDKQSGQKRNKLKVVAETMQIARRPRGGGGGGGGPDGRRRGASLSVPSGGARSSLRPKARRPQPDDDEIPF